MRIAVLATVLSSAVVSLSVADPASAAIKTSTNIAPQELSRALRVFAADRHLQILYTTDSVANRRTSGAVGELTVGEALEQLLGGTDLVFRYVDDATIAIVPGGDVAAANVANPASPRDAGATPQQGEKRSDGAESARKRSVFDRLRLSQASESSARQDAAESAANDAQRSQKNAATSEQARVTIPEILVQGSHSLNTDIERTVNDAQPRYVFDAETIQRSGAVSVGDFLKDRLTMNSTSSTPTQSYSGGGNVSRVNLRGLGLNQTLILINGRRAPAIFNGFSEGQPDLNGVPLAAIERIEVLPSSGSGIYGGSAVGGVINIVLKSDYVGAEARVGYENSFDSDSRNRNVNLSSGMSFEEGRTNVLFALAYSDTQPPFVGGRDLVQRGLDRIIDSSPAFFLPPNSPPFGATTNIRSANGSPLFGAGTASFASAPLGYAGGGGVAPLQQNAGAYNYDVPLTSQSGALRDAFGASTEVKSASLTVHRSFTSKLDLFAELQAGSNNSDLLRTSLRSAFTVPATAPTNPFGQSVVVTFPLDAAADQHFENETRHITTGFKFALPASWSAEGDYTWNFNRSAFNQPAVNATMLNAAIANGTLDVFRDVSAYPWDLGAYMQTRIGSFDATQNDLALHFAGPTLRLPAGVVTLSVGAEHRKDGAEDGTDRTITVTPPSPAASIRLGHSQSTQSVFAEAQVPIVSDANAMPGIRALDLQAAVRSERIEVHTGTAGVTEGVPTTITSNESSVRATDPTFGIRYRPIDDVMFRAYYGRAFLAPTYSQLQDVAPVYFPVTITDPRRGNTSYSVLANTIISNSRLEPERARSAGAGIVLEPRFIEGFRASVDYTRIEKDNIITQLTPQLILQSETSLLGRITRNPVAAGDPYGVGAIATIDATPVNLTKGLLEAYDVSITYRIPTERLGTFELFTLSTWQPHYKTQAGPDAPFTENAGVTSSFPLKFKGNAGVTWSYRGWTAGWTMRYFDSYIVSTNPAQIAAQGSLKVPSQSYHDVMVSRTFPAGAGDSGAARLLDDVDVTLGIKNLFDSRPPVDVGNPTYYYSWYGDPRLSTYYLSLTKRF